MSSWGFGLYRIRHDDFSPITWAWVGQILAIGTALALGVVACLAVLGLGLWGVKWVGLRLWWALGG